LQDAQRIWHPKNQKAKAWPPAGPWDYKQWNLQWDDFGNFNYGATGIAFGFSGRRLQREAGRVQNPREQGNPGSLLNPFGGTFPYGDDLSGQIQVMNGIEYAKCKENKCGGS
jgi:hypothetical protein